MSEDNVENINTLPLSTEDAEYDDVDQEPSESLLSLSKFHTPAANVNEESIVINTEEGTVIDVTKLSPLEKIRLVESKFGLKIDDPDPSCKKCHGRGYTGILANGSPDPCLCLHRTYKKENPRLWEQIVGARDNSSWNRKMFRRVKNLKAGPTTQTKKNTAKRYGKVMDSIARTDRYKNEKEIVEQAKALKEKLLQQYAEQSVVDDVVDSIVETPSVDLSNESLVAEVAAEVKNVEVE